MKKIYLVTGADGYLGNTIVKKLLKAGEKVRGLVLKKDQAIEVFKDFDSKNLELFEGDIRKIETLKAFFNVQDEKILIHTAAIVSIESAHITKNVYDVNVNGLRNILDLALKNNVKKMVHVASVHAVPCKDKSVDVLKEISFYDKEKVNGGYSKSKAIGAQMCLDYVKKYDMDISICLPSGIFGPYDYNNSYLTQLIKDFSKKRIPLSINAKYNYVDVRDAAEGIINASKVGRKGGSYLLAGQIYTLNEIFTVLSEVLNMKKPKVAPKFIAYLGLPFIQLSAKIHKRRPLYTLYSLEVLRDNCNFCIDKAKSELGFAPRTIKESLMDEVDFLRNQGKIR